MLQVVQLLEAQVQEAQVQVAVLEWLEAVEEDGSGVQSGGGAAGHARCPMSRPLFAAMRVTNHALGGGPRAPLPLLRTDVGLGAVGLVARLT